MGQELGGWGRNSCKSKGHISYCTTRRKALVKKGKRNRWSAPVMTIRCHRQLVGDWVGLDSSTVNKSDRRRQRVSLDSDSLRPLKKEV